VFRRAFRGLLTCLNNQFVISETIATLRLLRLVVDKSGFVENCRLVDRLCGEDQVDQNPYGFRLLYKYFTEYAKLSVEKGDLSRDSEHRKTMIAHIDDYIEILTKLEESLMASDQRRSYFKACAGLIPSQEDSDRFLRYETHLERQIDRTLNRLEQLQRMRKK
jgi:hypothetical protein